MIGLIDTEALRSVGTTATSQGETPDLAPRLQAARTPLAPTLQGAESAANAGAEATSSSVAAEGG